MSSCYHRGEAGEFRGCGVTKEYLDSGRRDRSTALPAGGHKARDHCSPEDDDIHGRKRTSSGSPACGLDLDEDAERLRVAVGRAITNPTAHRSELLALVMELAPPPTE
jgi:hypothetical protein